MNPRKLLASTLAALLAGATSAHADVAPVTVVPTGSFMADLVRVAEDARPFEDTHDIRRARVGVTIKQDGRFQLRLEHDLTDNSAPEISLQWTLPEGRSLKFGQFKQAYLLDDIINERQTPMLEPSLAAGFALSRRVGIEVATVRPDWTAQLAVFDQRLDGTQERLGIVGRYTRVIARGEESILHVGASAAVEDPQSDSFRASARPETYFGVPALVDTGTFAGVDRVRRTAIEGLWIDGPFSAQAEIAALQASRDVGSFDGHAGYVLLGWSPTGNPRSYAKGVVGSPVVGDVPAWELFLRASRIDLDDGALRGGRQTNLSLGATWYLNANMRWVASWIHTDSDRRGVADDPRVLALRAQITF